MIISTIVVSESYSALRHQVSRVVLVSRVSFKIVAEQLHRRNIVFMKTLLKKYLFMRRLFEEVLLYENTILLVKLCIDARHSATITICCCDMML